MNKFVLVKQSFYHEYDMLRFDVIVLNTAISLLSNLHVEDVEKAISILDELYYSLFQENAKKIIVIMKKLLLNEEDYSISKLLSGLKVIRASIYKKEKLYQKYASYIDNLQ